MFRDAKPAIAIFALSLPVSIAACSGSDTPQEPAFRPIETLQQPSTTASVSPTREAKTEKEAPAPTQAAEQVSSPSPAEKSQPTDPRFYTASNGRAPSAPACDGRWILIYESVYGQGDATPQELSRALGAYPQAQYALPGACPSMRARVDGQDIYPVYRDFGSDVSALCAAWVAGGRVANPRSLNTAGDFSQPC